MYRWQIRTWKDAQHYQSLGKYKLKLQGDTNTPENEKDWPFQVLIRIWRTETLALLVGVYNGTTNLENTLVVSWKVKHILAIWSSHSTPWYLPPKKEVYVHADKQLYLLQPQTGNAKCPLTGKWINKLWSIYPMEYSSAIKMHKSSTHATIWMIPK